MTTIISLLAYLFFYTHSLSPHPPLAAQAMETHKRKEREDSKSPPPPSQESKKRKADEGPASSSINSQRGITITFYNVGQGNCVLIENLDAKQALLVDCGSNEGTGPKGKDVRENLGKPIIEKLVTIADIANRLTQFNSVPIIMVTHMDGDHFNWIPDIVEEIKKNQSEKFPLNFVVSVGDGSRLKSKRLHEEEEKLIYNIKNYEGNNAFYIGQEKSFHQLFHELGLDGWILDLMAGAGAEEAKDKKLTKSIETNANSLVMKAIVGDCSVLLPGDANRITLDAIYERLESLEQKAEEVLSTTILLSAHHGSRTEESNRTQWIKDTSPQAIIMSAGLKNDYGHPDCRVLLKYLKEENTPYLKAEGPYHKLTCYGGFIDLHENTPLFFLKRKLTSSPFNGTEAIYNTFDQGNITVHLDGENFHLSYTGSEKEKDDNKDLWGTCTSPKIRGEGF